MAADCSSCGSVEFSAPSGDDSETFSVLTSVASELSRDSNSRRSFVSGKISCSKSLQVLLHILLVFRRKTLRILFKMLLLSSVVRFSPISSESIVCEVSVPGDFLAFFYQASSANSISGVFWLLSFPSLTSYSSTDISCRSSIS